MAEETKRLPRALSPSELLKTKIRTLPLEGVWQEALGQPAERGVWIIWGNSGSGKTSFALQLARELTKYGRVAYNSLEQGASLSMQEAIKRHELGKTRRGSFHLLSEDLETLSERLSRRQSPDFVIVDSLQYTGLDYRSYKAFKEKHKDKLIVFVSHAEGIKPEGRTANKVMYDADDENLCRGLPSPKQGTLH